MTETTDESLSERNERFLREYFGTRPGWTVVKLDTGKTRAADFRICEHDDCFLCEVKTVGSVRANYPGRPIDYYLEERKKRQKEIEKWKKENPDGHLILRPGEFEFIYGNEVEFTKKYSGHKKSTEVWFNVFAQTMKEYFASSSVRALPYSLRLDSDDLYVPSILERNRFFKWLEDELTAISNSNPSWQWHVDKLQYGHAALYSAFYQIHNPTHENDIRAEYQLTLEGPRNNGALEINIYSYGGLNLESITRNIDDGLRQLESSATRENDHQIPRVIVIAFESSIGFEHQELSSHIIELLKSRPNLSAIAVLELTPDGTPPPPEDGFEAWIEFGATTPWVPRFTVYHNRSLQDVKPLPIRMFSDKRSVQLTPT